MSKKNWFTGWQSDLYNYVRIPKLLIQHDEYKGLSIEHKFLYALLLDRMSLSSKNGWRDDNNRVYVYYTREEIGEICGVSVRKVTEMLNKLEEFGLIERQRQGLGKPNKIYVNSFTNVRIPAFEPELQGSHTGDADSALLDSTDLHSSNTDISNTDISNKKLLCTSDEAHADTDAVKNTFTSSMKQEIIDVWNSIDSEHVANIVSINHNRAKSVKARIDEHGYENFLKAIENVKASKFLKSGTFGFSFNWFIKPNNFVKVLEGQYNKQRKPNSSGTTTNNIPYEPREGEIDLREFDYR